MINLDKSRILITGGNGFLGKALSKKLKEKDLDFYTPYSSEYDLRNRLLVEELFTKYQPEIIIHLAAKSSGIGGNQKYPGDHFFDNISMGVNLVEVARINKVKKFVNIGTVCSYPKYTPIPFKEENLWDGYPEETNAPYGLSKKAIISMIQAYKTQFGFNGISLLLTNMYGIYDDFDLETSHVIPAIIKKIEEAIIYNKEKINLWGDGSPTRDFLFSEDAAEGIILATEKYEGIEPVNLGSGKEVSIKELAETIAEIMNYKGKIIWDTSKPGGQPRRLLDITRAKEYFNFRAETELTEGLKTVISWYKELKDN